MSVILLNTKATVKYFLVLFVCLTQELRQQHLHFSGRTITYTTSDPGLSDANISRTSHVSISAILQLGVAENKRCDAGVDCSNINAT